MKGGTIRNFFFSPYSVKTNGLYICVKENEMKTILKLATALVLLSLIIGCAGAPATTQPPAPTQAPPATQPPAVTQPPATAAPPPATAEPKLTANEQWAKDNGVGPYQPAQEDWNAIVAAAKKEGSVVVYANSSKFEKLLDAWNALYPDIKLDGGDTDNISTKMSAEQEAGNVVGDVWFNSDGHILYGEFMPKEWIWSYMPPGVVETEVTADRPFAISRHSVDVIGYNQEINKDGCPLTNWWQLVDSKLQGKFFMEDPISDPSTTAKFTLIVEHADEMAAAYKDYFGKDWTTDEAAAPDAFGVTPENAGYLFLKKLALNKPVAEPGGDEVDTAFASLGMDPNVEPGYGWTGWDSYDSTLSGELAMAPCLTVEPVIGVFKSNYLAIANNAPHPNAAKLFIAFALSKDGFKPWNKIGTYPAAEGLPVAEGMPPAKDIKVWPSDDLFAWQNNSKVRDFWAIYLLAGQME
jgi:iron(III) transport system substrate-binding protein